MKVRSGVKARSNAKKKKTKNTTTKQTMTQITTKKNIKKRKLGPNCELESFYRRATLFIKFEQHSLQTFKHFFFPNVMFN